MGRAIEFLNRIETRKLVYALPLISLLHELEEWNILAWHRFVNVGVPDVTDLHVRTALTFVILLNLVWVGISLLSRSRKVMYVALIPLLAINIGNGFQHLIWLLEFGIYAPGVIFGFCLSVPVSLLIVGRIFMERAVVSWYPILFGLFALTLVILTLLRGNEMDPMIGNAMILGRSVSLSIFGR